MSEDAISDDGGPARLPPPPLTPCQCNLRGYEFMPLYGERLFSSDFEAKATDAEFRAAVNLWWRAWTQVPAASLPNDEVVLCKLAGLGRDMASWRKVREMALHGFELCADGRLYHKALAPLAVNSYAWRARVEHKREGDRNRQKQARARRAGRMADIAPDTAPDGGDLARDVTARSAMTSPQDRTGTETETGTGTEKTASGLRPGAPGEPDARVAPLSGGDAATQDGPAETARQRKMRSALFREGLPLLRALTGRSESQCRRLLGALLRLTLDDCARLQALLHEVEALRPADPATWLFAAARRQGRGGMTAVPAARADGFALLQRLKARLAEATDPADPAGPVPGLAAPGPLA
ncbi:DUF1376 domain-containing protein [Rhodovastum atsumiense]|nr:DUF1376 domain-containing protein [Rhodovastum atsumiense]